MILLIVGAILAFMDLNSRSTVLVNSVSSIQIVTKFLYIHYILAVYGTHVFLMKDLN
jgi:hypothetical protein